MNLNLLNTLIKKNIITTFTEIDAQYKGRDISGIEIVPVITTFVIMEIRINESGYEFVGADARDGNRRLIFGRDIVAVDGMDAERLASVYGIDGEGNRLVQGKRRGRKSKATMAAEALTEI